MERSEAFSDVSEWSNETRAEASLLLSMFTMSCTTSWSAVEMVVLVEPGLRKRQTTAQSSTFEAGNLNLQARTADSTSARAAVDCGADATMFTASSFVRTSQICQKEGNHVQMDMDKLKIWFDKLRKEKRDGKTDFVTIPTTHASQQQDVNIIKLA